MHFEIKPERTKKNVRKIVTNMLQTAKVKREIRTATKVQKPNSSSHNNRSHNMNQKKNEEKKKFVIRMNANDEREKKKKMHN